VNGLEVTRWRQADELLAAALERPPAERRAFVQAASADSAAVDMVLKLLSLEEHTPAFLDRGAMDQAMSFLPAPEPLAARVAAGDRLGAYRLIQEIGRGGMSVVFLAERDDGRFQKRVAIKVLPVRPYLVPEHFRARFQGEREILAQLEHPAIARLLDGGETDSGEPYLVMEYVEGQPIDGYCDGRRLSVDDRIALFVKVGEAVAYAHQNLVVHRDIKPSNVLVTGAGEAKLLDFGIAKVLSDGGDASFQTMTGERVMTPAYASPEQVRGDPIRTVSDVYSLGVLLHHLLTGALPYKAGALPHEMAAAILDQEPARPSAGALGAEVAAARASEPQRLRARLRGDLDAIVGKALRKAPERRYPSVEALLDDLRRHLAGTAVSARADDRAYRLGRLARRNWPALAAVSALLLVGGGLAAFHARRIQSERDVARRQAATAQAVTGFVTSLFGASDAWEVSQTRAETLTARALLAEGEKRIRTDLAAEPEVRAELLSTLGSSHSTLGLNKQAEALLTEALALHRQLQGADGKAVANDLERLALVYYRTGDFARAESLDRQAYEIRRRRFGPDSDEAAASLGKMAMDLRKKGDAPQSEALFRQSLQLWRRLHGDEHKEVAAAMKGLAMIRRERGDLGEAESLGRQALEISRKTNGEGNPLTTEHRSDLATILRTKGDLEGAERLSRQALQDTRAWFGDEHPNVAIRWNTLALTLQARGDYDGAERAYRECMRLNRKFWGNEHPAIAATLKNLGTLLQDRGDLEGAEPLLQQALDMRRKLLKPGHADIAMTIADIGLVALDKNQPKRAAELLQEALASFKKNAPDNLWAGRVSVDLGRALVRLDRPAEAEPLVREGLAILQKTRPPTHPLVVVGRAALGQCLLAQGKPDEAEPLIAGATRPEGLKPHERKFLDEVSRQLAAARAH
jgi:serine/threonine-protein kinase